MRLFLILLLVLFFIRVESSAADVNVVVSYRTRWLRTSLQIRGSACGGEEEASEERKDPTVVIDDDDDAEDNDDDADKSKIISRKGT